MDRLDAMSVVIAVGEGGSLSAAARRLGVPLPTVSRRVSDLETHLNTRLFNRSTRRLILTDAGEAYLHACKRIIEDVTEAERAASGEFNAPRGDLVISAPIVFGRLHVLPTITDRDRSPDSTEAHREHRRGCYRRGNRGRRTDSSSFLSDRACGERRCARHDAEAV
jgi:DNA-binding transcriptional LysR family regulator